MTGERIGGWRDAQKEEKGIKIPRSSSEITFCPMRSACFAFATDFTRMQT